MTTDEQALKLIRLAETINNGLGEEGILYGTLGVSNSLDILCGDKLFAAIAHLSKQKVEISYSSAAFHGEIIMGNVKFSVCHNLL